MIENPQYFRSAEDELEKRDSGHQHRTRQDSVTRGLTIYDDSEKVLEWSLTGGIFSFEVSVEDSVPNKVRLGVPCTS